jgi:hypothetical protein
VSARILRPRDHQLTELAFGGLMALHLHECHSETTSGVVKVWSKTEGVLVALDGLGGSTVAHQGVANIAIDFGAGGLACRR